MGISDKPPFETDSFNNFAFFIDRHTCMIYSFCGKLVIVFLNCLVNDSFIQPQRYNKVIMSKLVNFYDCEFCLSMFRRSDEASCIGDGVGRDIHWHCSDSHKQSCCRMIRLASFIS